MGNKHVGHDPAVAQIDHLKARLSRWRGEIDKAKEIPVQHPALVVIERGLRLGQQVWRGGRSRGGKCRRHGQPQASEPQSSDKVASRAFHGYVADQF